MPFSRLTLLKELLELEQKEERQFYQEEVQLSPLKERVQNGYTWYPTETIKTGFTYGDHAFVILQRNNENPHRLKTGKTVSLSSNEEKEDRKPLTGIIHYVNKAKMKIILNSNHIPEWVMKENVIVDLLLDERSYNEMFKALKKVVKAEEPNIQRLKDVFFQKVPPYFVNNNHVIDLPMLNPAQNDAVNNIMSAQDIAIVHGPPGTGKTTILVQAIKLTVKAERQTLVCAPSNAAVDYLTLKLTQAGLKVVRLGNLSRMDDIIIDTSLDGQLAGHSEYKSVKKIKIQAADARKKAGKYKRTFGKEDYKLRKEAYKEAKELESWARDLETKLIEQIIDSADVITCTLVGAASNIIKDYRFKTVFIDEAAQALEPMTWIPILKSEKVVLAGDPYQLPPTVKSNKASKGGLSITLMEQLLPFIKPINLLNIQYRMHQVIMGFSNEYFYNGALVAHESVVDHMLDERDHYSLEFVDTAGCDFEEVYDEKNKSRCNPEEQLILFEHLYQLTEQVDQIENHTIGIISPYREQVNIIKTALREDNKLQLLNISVDTIDAFQGQERDIIIISLVRSNPKGEIGFLKDYRRMNVAMTRAKKLLVVIGDSATIGSNSFYNKLLQYIDNKGIYRTAWEFMA